MKNKYNDRMTSLQKFGQNLRKIRENKDLTQEELAVKADLSANYYAKIERGEINITFKTLQKIAVALKTKSSEILPF